jgi:hypothetical protein
MCLHFSRPITKMGQDDEQVQIAGILASPAAALGKFGTACTAPGELVRVHGSKVEHASGLQGDGKQLAMLEQL